MNKTVVKIGSEQGKIKSYTVLYSKTNSTSSQIHENPFQTINISEYDALMITCNGQIDQWNSTYGTYILSLDPLYIDALEDGFKLSSGTYGEPPLYIYFGSAGSMGLDLKNVKQGSIKLVTQYIAANGKNTIIGLKYK